MNELSKLRPIKPNIPITQSGHFDYRWLILILAVMLSVFIFFYFRKYLQIKKEKKELLNLIDNPKKFAYEFTKKAKKFKNKKNEKLLEEILLKLQNYKYKKEVENIDQKTVKMIKNYLGVK